MPLDGHAYLSRRGWAGKGKGLRQGSIAKPLHVFQKKTLSGLGKDRDEAFPFWDHVFTAAANSITIKVPKDDHEQEDPDEETDQVVTTIASIRRTTTGIISNRRPVVGTPASSSGESTPQTSFGRPTTSLLGIAKQQAAKAVLYSKFYRGPVLVAEDEQSSSGALTPRPNPTISEQSTQVASVETPDNAKAIVRTKAKKRKRDKEESNKNDLSLRKFKKKARTALAEDHTEAVVADVPSDSPLPPDEAPGRRADSSVPIETPTRKKKKKRQRKDRVDSVIENPEAVVPAPTTGDARLDGRKKRKKRRLTDDAIAAAAENMKRKETESA